MSTRQCLLLQAEPWIHCWRSCVRQLLRRKINATAVVVPDSRSGTRFALRRDSRLPREMHLKMQRLEVLVGRRAAMTLAA
jgi:hypothetical protein